MLPEFENEEVKSIENFEELLALKVFIEENQNELKTSSIIFKLKSIFKVKALVEQPSTPYLINAKIFEFCLNNNLTQKFKLKDTLLDLVPDYISIGYDKERTDMKENGYPIWLTFSWETFTKKNLSVLKAINHKNLYKLSLLNPIYREWSLWTKAEQTLLKAIKNIDTLKEIDFSIKEGDNVNSYAFKNLTKLRKEQIIDAIWGLSTSESSDNAPLQDLKSLQVVTDLVSWMN